tara:strand:+ start:495 stop:1337 length:843 start_codon:yes stop_codon:yes gene_type:complete
MGNYEAFSVVSITKDSSFEDKLRNSFFSNQRIIFSFYIIMFSVAEVLAVVEPMMGFLAHSILIPIIGIHVSICHRLDPKSSKLALALSPVPLVRIVSISSPVIQFTILQWFLVISMVLFSSILITIILIGDEMSDYGFKLPERKYYPLEISIILCGFLFGFVEYQILTPNSLVETLTFVGLIAPLVALYLGTGLLEELLFRGIIQRHSIESLGKWPGILFTNLIFMILHTGWESGYDLIFVGVVGIIFSIVVVRTGSIIGVSFSHAITNLSLFVLTPELF